MKKESNIVRLNDTIAIVFVKIQEEKIMAFFEDLGKKISQTSQGVMQKTKDTAEIMKLSSMISDYEKGIENLQTQLGKKYFELHQDSCESELQDMVNQIKDLLLKINECAEQKRKLKGEKLCPNCGKEVAAGTIFCGSCGTKIVEPEAEVKEPEAQPVAPRKCPNCDAEVTDDSAFCMNCGTKL